MNERPAEVSKWLSEPLTAYEKKRIMHKDRNSLTYKEIVIKNRILQESEDGIQVHFAPKGARAPATSHLTKHFKLNG